ncbi:MAG: AsnC family protein [Candidatus Rokuibacteriota bacterium]
MDERGASPDAWWDELDAAVMACLETNGAMAPHEVGRHLGLSEAAAVSLLCLLAFEGKVRICLVEHGSARSADTRAA